LTQKHTHHHNQRLGVGGGGGGLALAGGRKATVEWEEVATYFTHTILILYSYFTHTLLILYFYFTDKREAQVATLYGHRDSVYCVCCSQLPYAKHCGGTGNHYRYLVFVLCIYRRTVCAAASFPTLRTAEAPVTSTDT